MYNNNNFLLHHFLDKSKFQFRILPRPVALRNCVNLNMSEKLCLKWNDFQENVATAFENLKGDKDLSDVTLACEDGQQFEAHKVILVASSPFFHHLLKINRHAHPLHYD